MQKDSLQRFLFENRSIRGELVHLNASYQAIMEHHPYPSAVAQLLGKALSAAALLCAPLKYEGSLILQIQGDGHVYSLVAQCNHHLHVRGLAKWDTDNPLPQTGGLLGHGHLAITIIPENSKERYQGIVAVNDDNLSVMLEQYFLQSEQLPTRVWLAANEYGAAGLLLQQMPDTNKTESEFNYWDHITQLAGTITDNELLHLDNETVLHRLFNQEEVRLFSSHPVCFRCRCSVEKMEQAIIISGKEEIDDILRMHPTVDVTCEFCNRHYSFDKVDVERLFHRHH